MELGLPMTRGERQEEVSGLEPRDHFKDEWERTLEQSHGEGHRIPKCRAQETEISKRGFGFQGKLRTEEFRLLFSAQTTAAVSKSGLTE